MVIRTHTQSRHSGTHSTPDVDYELAISLMSPLQVPRQQWGVRETLG